MQSLCWLLLSQLPRSGASMASSSLCTCGRGLLTKFKFQNSSLRTQYWQQLCHSQVTARERPVVILLPWLMAKPKNVEKYAEVYRENGYDVLVRQLKVQDFLWPRRSFTIVNNLFSDLRQETLKRKPIIVHSFSVGSFLLSVMFTLLLRDPSSYQDISERMIGFIADSITYGGLGHMAEGIVTSASRQPAIQTAAKCSILSYFKLTYPWTVKLYDEFIENWKNFPLKQVPLLYLYSKNDPMSDHYLMEELVSYQKNLGYSIYSHCWDKSGHAQHLLYHRDEYLKSVREFLKLVDPSNPAFYKSKY